MKKIKIGDICEILNGFAFKSEQYVVDGIRIIRIANVQKGYIEDSSPVFYPENTFDLDKYMLKKGDLLMSLTGNVGRVALLTEEFLPAALNQRVACLRLKTDEISKSFLYHYLNSDLFERLCVQSSNGVAQKNMSTEWLKEYKIPLYGREEQKAIVSILDRVSAIIALRKQELSELDNLIKSRFVEMFGDPDKNPLSWDECALSKKINVIGGYAFMSEKFDENSGIPVLRIGNINTGYFKPVNMVYWKKDENLERYAIYPGDLVISLTGTVGKDDYGNVCILGNNYEMYYLNQRNAKLEILEGLDKYYLSQLLKFEQIKKKLTGISRGVRQANISNKDILDLVIPVPPIEIQKQYAKFIQQVDKSKIVIQKSLDETQKLFDSLMQEYFE